MLKESQLNSLSKSKAEKKEGLFLSDAELSELIEKDAIISKLPDISSSQHQKIAEMMILKNKSALLSFNIDKFLGVDHEIISRLIIERGEIAAVAAHLDKFIGINHQEIASLLLDEKKGLILSLSLCKFKGLNQNILVRLAEAGYCPDALRHLNSFENIDFDSLRDILLKYFPLKEIVLYGDEEIKKRIPWFESLQKLRSIQDFAAKEEYCPWKKELQPLIDETAKKQKVLSLEKKEDGEIFLSFVKNFGALNLPLLLEIYVDLEKAGKKENIKPENRELLAEIIGSAKLDKLPNIENIINELRNFKRNFQSELLKDKLPEKIDTKIGLELFHAIKGTTNWEDEEIDLETMIMLFKDSAQKNPELIKNTEGYKEKTVDVSLVKRVLAPEEEKEKRESNILENQALQDIYFKLQNALNFAVENSEIGEFWLKEKSKIIKILQKQILSVNENFDSGPEKAKEGLNKNIRDLEEKIIALEKIDFKQEDEKPLIFLLEKLMPIKEAKDAMLKISARHLFLTCPLGWREKLEFLSKTEAYSAEHVRQMADFLKNYAAEHYLNSGLAKHDSSKIPFSEKLRKYLEGTWNLKNGAENNIVVKSSEALDDMEENKILKTKAQVSFVPAKGLLRVFSGDIGDSCYAKRHVALARGDFSAITSIIMVTNRGTAQERLEGSVLFMETKTPDGKKVLNIRANNPRENLLMKVDSENLIKEIINYAVETAKARGMDMVVLPIDKEDDEASASNRDKVRAYYKKNFRDKRKVDLINEPETNFNGYNNWDSHGDHPVFVVWEKE